MLNLRSAALVAVLAMARAAATQTSSDAPRWNAQGVVHLPAMEIPFSDLSTDESRKAFVAYRDLHAKLAAAQRAQKRKQGESAAQFNRRLADEVLMKPWLAQLRSKFEVEIRPALFGGVQTDVITPIAKMRTSNANRVLLNLHGGAYTVGARYEGQVESVPIAALGNIKVITVDYGMGPEHHFPAASEDVAAVYREILHSYRPENVGIYGCSAGAHLAAQSIAWFQAHGLPTPGAAVMAGGGAVLDHWGDANYFASAIGGYHIPTIPPGMNIWSYFEHDNLSDPLISPARSDAVLRRFPPSLLISGTRDPALSVVIFTHRRLVELGVHADLQVWEGAPHCFIYWDSPESREAWHAMIRFFDGTLGHS